MSVASVAAASVATILSNLAVASHAAATPPGQEETIHTDGEVDHFLNGCWQQQHSPSPETMDGIIACFNDKHEAEMSVAYFQKHQIELGQDLWQWRLQDDLIYITADAENGSRVNFSCHLKIQTSPDILSLGNCKNMQTTRDVSGEWRRKKL